MPVSSARLLANRRNATKSTGPRTAEGKARSRRNSYKHGLTGDGVVLSETEASEVSRRFETLHDELQPSGEAGRILLRRFAYLSVRLEKCEEYDTSATAERVRHAVEAFDDRRLTHVEELAAMLPTDPSTAARRLQGSPEGIDWLLRHWDGLREDLLLKERQGWTLNHWTRFEQLTGQPGADIRLTRIYALTQAVSGYFVYLNDGDGTGLDDSSKIEWARSELASLIDAEVARLHALKLTLDLKSVERDRAEAPSRALFDPSLAQSQARKYEAATERAMYKALDRFHDVELAAIEAQPSDANYIAEEPSDRLASLLTGSRMTVESPIEPPGTAPRSVYLREPATNHVPITIGRAHRSA